MPQEQIPERTMWYCETCGMVRNGDEHNCTLALKAEVSALAERVERAEALLKEAQTLLNDAVKNGCLILGRCELDSRISSFLHDGTKGEKP